MAQVLGDLVHVREMEVDALTQIVLELVWVHELDRAHRRGQASTLVRASDVPIDGVTPDQLVAFRAGDGLFDLPFRDADGLGPYYIRTSCGACHEAGSRGPGLVQKMLVLRSDGVTPDAEQSLLPFGHTIRLGLTAGAKTPLSAPDDPRVKVTTRVGPPILGRGYMEAILDSEIERVAAEQAARKDGIHGTINHVVSPRRRTRRDSSDSPKGQIVIGRFGLKARVATLDDFTADLFQGDMGSASFTGAPRGRA